MIELEGNQQFLTTLDELPLRVFSTADFIEEFRVRFPDLWDAVEQEYGVGGKGAGRYNTSFTHVARALSRLARQERIYKQDYRPAPDWWGSSVVQYWSFAREVAAEPDNEAVEDEEYREGGLRLKKHLRRERHWGLAKKKKADFIAKHGRLFCERCELDPVGSYGAMGGAIIEVHHAATFVGAMGEGHTTKLSDLQCLCANCHRFVHAEFARHAK